MQVSTVLPPLNSCVGKARIPSSTWQPTRSEEHTSELQSQSNLVCRLLLEKKKTNILTPSPTALTQHYMINSAHSTLDASLRERRTTPSHLPIPPAAHTLTVFARQLPLTHD